MGWTKEGVTGEQYAWVLRRDGGFTAYSPYPPDPENDAHDFMNMLDWADNEGHPVLEIIYHSMLGKAFHEFRRTLTEAILEEAERE